MADESFYKGEGNEVVRAKARLGELEQLLEEAYERWEELETVREEYLKKFYIPYEILRSEEFELDVENKLYKENMVP